MALGGNVTDFDIKFLIASRGTCAVCLETVKDHRMLPCGHVFCLSCLRPLVVGSRIDCPSCKDRRELVRGGVYFLPKSLLLNDLLEHFCSKCAKKKREVRCEQSQKWFCLGCHKYCPTCTNKAKEELSSKQAFVAGHSECLVNIRSVHETYRDRTKVMCKQIRDHAENMVQKIRDEEKKLLEEVNFMTKKEEERLVFFQTNIEALKEQIKSSKAIVSPKNINHYNNIFEICEEWKRILDNPSWDKSITFNSITFLPETRSVLESKFIVGRLVSQSKAPNFHSDYPEGDTFGHWGTQDGQFDRPSHIAVSPQSGNLVVVDSGNNRVQVFDALGQHLSTFGSKGSGEGELNLDGSSGVAATSQGVVFVADTKNNRVQIFTEYGDFLMVFGPDGRNELTFNSPSGIAYSETTNELIVCDFGNRRVLMFELDGTLKQTIFTEPMHPLDLAVSLNGDIIIACGSYPSAELRRYSVDGRHVSTVGTGENGSHRLEWPGGVAFSGDGHILVTDTANDGAYLLENDGQLLHTFASNEESDRNLSCPVGVACMNDGRVVVIDQDNHRVNMFSLQ